MANPKMRKRLNDRLRQLEHIHMRARTIASKREREDDQSDLQRFRLFLQLRGIEQRPIESLAEALCRALEISGLELRAQMAAGIDPIHKWLTDHGAFEELERRKAAGEWPAAEALPPGWMVANGTQVGRNPFAHSPCGARSDQSQKTSVKT